MKDKLQKLCDSWRERAKHLRQIASNVYQTAEWASHWIETANVFEICAAGLSEIIRQNESQTQTAKTS